LLSTWPSEFLGIPADMSTNRSIVVGTSLQPDSKNRAFRWSATAGIVDLGVLPGGDMSGAYGVSPDGDFVVGNSGLNTGVLQLFLWSAATGMVGLGVPTVGLPPGLQRALANDVAPGGTCVAISATTNNAAGGVSAEVAYLWDKATGYQSLGALPAGWTRTRALAISDDGKTIVGVGGGEPTFLVNLSYVFRWTSETGIVPLPHGDAEIVDSSKIKSTPDAGIVVGTRSLTGDVFGDAQPFVWDAAHGTRNLKQVLAQEHGFHDDFVTVLDISDDARSLLLSRPNSETWRLTLDAPLVDRAVPKPAQDC
jgi:probable HAF family extracellular repeat protein